jgi:DNA-binding MarR family transcriptional regulator
MKKATFDIDVCKIIRRSPEATPATLATYTALREIATEKGSCEFITSFKAIKKRALISENAVSRHLNLMEKRKLVQKKQTKEGLKFRLIKVYKS